MAVATSARSLLRSSCFRSAGANITTKSRAARSPFCLSRQKVSSSRFLRSPVELSCCVESLHPLHSATSSALLTSMLAVSHRGYFWLSEAGSDDV